MNGNSARVRRVQVESPTKEPQAGVVPPLRILRMPEHPAGRNGREGFELIYRGPDGTGFRVTGLWVQSMDDRALVPREERYPASLTDGGRYWVGGDLRIEPLGPADD